MRGSGHVQRGVSGSVSVTSSPTWNGRSTTTMPGSTVRRPEGVDELGAARPRRHAQAQRPRLPVGLRDAHRDGAVGGIGRGHLEADPATAGERRGDPRIGVLVQLDAAVVGRGQVARQAGQRARHVGGAAGDEEPRFAQARRRPLALDVLARHAPRHALVQRVGVEEVASVRRRRCRHDVVQRALDEVGEAVLAGRQQQPPGEHHRADAGARLRVRPVGGEHEVVAERLAGVLRAHPAGDVGAPGDRRLPLLDHAGEQLVVAGLDGDVDGRRGEVHRPDGVAAEHGGVADRDVVLEVRLPEPDLAERAPPATLDEQRRLVEVALLPRRAGELDEAELDLRVAARPARCRRRRTWRRRGRRRPGRCRRTRRGRSTAAGRPPPGTGGRRCTARGPTRGRCSAAADRGARTRC